MKLELAYGGQKVVASVTADGEGQWRVSLDGGPELCVRGARRGDAEWVLDFGEGPRAVWAHVDGRAWIAQEATFGLSGDVVDPRRLGTAGSGDEADGTVSSPMPGAVVRIAVKAGDRVAEGDVVVVVEAMKMENEFKSAVSGVVTEVCVAAGDAIDAGAALVHISPEESV